MPPKWDDWKCYRCNKWQRREDALFPHTTPSGFIVSLCLSCAEKKRRAEGDLS